MNPAFVVLEIGAVAFFVAMAWMALRRGRLPFLELVSAAIFGLLLEQANQVIFETYEYSPDFLLSIDRAPIVIGLTWALIIAGAMRITDALGVRGRYAPFVDSVLAIMLDLAFDAVAIRMGLWTWRDIGPQMGWFGVPAGNFHAWLFVTLGFSLVTRWLRDAAHRRPALAWLQLLVPIPAFVILTAGIWSFAVLKPLTDPAPGGGLGVFAVTLALFGAVSAWAIWGPDRGRPDGAADAILDLRVSFASRLAIHFVFLAALLWLGLAATAPVLLAVALLMLAAEVPLSVMTHARLAGAASTAVGTGAETETSVKPLAARSERLP
ncbi:MAG TPA: carotenoid biosynthesis protein [Candidatus Limnocylindria bacterium]|nr:carotenoid biosynthesis protein [Candidatus Limnocylindria bacterium]